MDSLDPLPIMSRAVLSISLDAAAAPRAGEAENADAAPFSPANTAAAARDAASTFSEDM